MVTMNDIQVKVAEAQTEIQLSHHDPRHLNIVQHVIWPEIKKRIRLCVDPRLAVPRDKENLGLSIHKRLDEQDLHGGVFQQIVVEKLNEDLQIGKVLPPDPSEEVIWLPY
jgi:hypothetical protein